MKRFILLLGFLLLGIGTVTGQSYQNQQRSRNYIDWKIENPNEWGSFYWSVTQQWNGKMYIYQVYLYSNSYFQTKRDGVHNDKAITYIRNLLVVMHEVDGRDGRIYNTVQVPVAVATADYALGRPVAHFWSHSRQNNFQLTFEACSPFDYSRY